MDGLTSVYVVQYILAFVANTGWKVPMAIRYCTYFELQSRNVVFLVFYINSYLKCH